LGVYVHFPWCLEKCPYCDFLSIASPRDSIPHAEYAAAVLNELEQRAAELTGYTLKSVFIGGGTPSLWHPAELGRVVEAILARFDAASENTEITVECNPTSLDLAHAKQLVDHGVNRLSVGVQALDRARLEFLGRLHDPSQALSAVRAALSSSVPRVSADLIFGVAGQSVEQARDEARTVAELGVTHLSAYALTIEPGTRFGALARKAIEDADALDDKDTADLFTEVSREADKYLWFVEAHRPQ
jgi:oxygen-independent coproporphyrinogen-3 oxidase